MTLQVLALAPLANRISAAQAELVYPITMFVDRVSVKRLISDPLLVATEGEKSVQYVI